MPKPPQAAQGEGGLLPLLLLDLVLDADSSRARKAGGRTTGLGLVLRYATACLGASVRVKWP